MYSASSAPNVLSRRSATISSNSASFQPVASLHWPWAATILLNRVTREGKINVNFTHVSRQIHSNYLDTVSHALAPLVAIITPTNPSSAETPTRLVNGIFIRPG